jgi:hypothetical protein
MPEGRFVSKSISHSEQLAEVSFEADFLFGRCLPHLDREGRLTGNPDLVKSTACPLRKEITTEKVPQLLAELARAELVVWYETAGKKVLHFPGFRNHQKGMKLDREADSRLPAFDPERSRNLGVGGHSGVGPDQLRSSSGPTADKLPASEVEVEVEGEVEVKKTNADAFEAEPRRLRASNRSESSNRGSAGGVGSDDDEEAGDAESRVVHATLAPLIRDHLWLGDDPPPNVLLTDPDWDMGRELHTAKRLMKRAKISLDEMAGAIPLTREVMEFDDEPLTMRIFNVPGRLDRIHDCVHVWRKLQASKQNGKRVRGVKSVAELLNE